MTPIRPAAQMRSAAHVVAEIKRNIELYSCTEIHFYDETFTVTGIGRHQAEAEAARRGCHRATRTTGYELLEDKEDASAVEPSDARQVVNAEVTEVNSEIGLKVQVLHRFATEVLQFKRGADLLIRLPESAIVTIRSAAKSSSGSGISQ